MILVTPKSRDKFKTKKTFGELEVGDTYYAYFKHIGGYKEIQNRTISKISSNNDQYHYIVKIGGPLVTGDYINLYYGKEGMENNVVYKDSSITINKPGTLIYATTKEELEEAIKYYS